MKITTLQLIIIWNDDMNPVNTTVVQQELQYTKMGKNYIILVCYSAYFLRPYFCQGYHFRKYQIETIIN